MRVILDSSILSSHPFRW